MTIIGSDNSHDPPTCAKLRPCGNFAGTKSIGTVVLDDGFSCDHPRGARIVTDLSLSPIVPHVNNYPLVATDMRLSVTEYGQASLAMIAARLANAPRGQQPNTPIGAFVA